MGTRGKRRCFEFSGAAWQLACGVGQSLYLLLYFTNYLIITPLTPLPCLPDKCLWASAWSGVLKSYPTCRHLLGKTPLGCCGSVLQGTMESRFTLVTRVFYRCCLCRGCHPSLLERLFGTSSHFSIGQPPFCAALPLRQIPYREFVVSPWYIVAMALCKRVLGRP